jgi:hypothetical protein
MAARVAGEAAEVRLTGGQPVEREGFDQLR